MGSFLTAQQTTRPIQQKSCDMPENIFRLTSNPALLSAPLRRVPPNAEMLRVSAPLPFRDDFKTGRCSDAFYVREKNKQKKAYGRGKVLKCCLDQHVEKQTNKQQHLVATFSFICIFICLNIQHFTVQLAISHPHFLG